MLREHLGHRDKGLDLHHVLFADVVQFSEMTLADVVNRSKLHQKKPVEQGCVRGRKAGEQLKLVENYNFRKALPPYFQELLHYLKTCFYTQVGYPTSLLSVRALLDNDFANIAVSPDKASLI